MHRFFAVITLLVMGGLGSLDAATVLVLPFFNHSKLEGIDWIGESISEAVHDSLSSEGLLVVDREDRLEAYRRLSLRPGAELTRASIIKIGQTLDADSIVFGSYELLSPSSFKSDSGKDDSKGTLRIAARLIDLKRLAAGSEFSELGAIEDLTALENHLSWQTLGFVDEKTKPNEQEFLRKRPVVRLDAVESYVRGLLAQNPDERHRYFMKAARLDEHYSQPCFQLGKAAWTMRDYRATANWLARVNHSDPHYFEAQFFLGLCRYNLRDFPGAEQAFQVVAAAVPLNEVYNDLAAAQSRQGNFPAAAASFRKALEGDSSDPDYHFNLAYALWRSGKFSDAVTSFRATLERNPHDAEATTLLGRALKDDGPKPGDTRAEARERLKTSYEENAYKQLQAELHSRK